MDNSKTDKTTISHNTKSNGKANAIHFSIRDRMKCTEIRKITGVREITRTIKQAMEMGWTHCPKKLQQTDNKND